ncbi:hypothetical protein LTR09_007497 [Extremus antarcticus]|uniref:Uncharacterized protein n=1 Tax=Extremus antarcticus TaxID=702011 RepID=A0AAJ0G720_9PEZI|nr:hypothetical protein LTR09_007497 [Extremus antarcticus]
MSDLISTRFQSTLSHTNDALLHTSRLLSTTTGLKSTLSTILFTSTLLHSYLTPFLLLRYRTAFATPHSSTSVPSKPSAPRDPSAPFTIPESLRTLTASKLSRTCSSLRSLSQTAADAWLFLRLFDLFHLYQHAHDIWEKPHRDPAVKTLLWAEVGSAACFHALENVAFLSMKWVLPGMGGPSFGDAKRLMRWSGYFWVAGTVLEGLRLARVWQLGWREELGAEKEEEEGVEGFVEVSGEEVETVGSGSEKVKSEELENEALGTDVKGHEGEGVVQVESKELERRWRIKVRNAVDCLPMALHWRYMSPMEGPNMEGLQGVLGLVPSVVWLRDAWWQTA